MKTLLEVMLFSDVLIRKQLTCRIAVNGNERLKKQATIGYVDKVLLADSYRLVAFC